MPKITCAHTFIVPGDGWEPVKIYAGGKKRLSRCRLCKQHRVEVYRGEGRWSPIEQLAFTFENDQRPAWVDDFRQPTILDEDWDWSK